LIIEPISRNHNREAFDCGVEELTLFLREQALQDHSTDLRRTFVMVDEDADASRVIGYHTLVMLHVTQDELPPDKLRIKTSIPAILLGQLALDQEFQKRGYGEYLLMDAQAKLDQIAQKTGVRGMVLDARNEELVRWYEEHDFARKEGSLRMFKSIDLIRKLKLNE
jgi:GNAT superfamily N-acetyltransferase